MDVLTDDIIEKRLLRFPDWEHKNNALYAEFEFNNFRIAFECEAQGHHPNWSNVYNVLKIALSTHDANGVTEKDFKLASAIEAIVEVDD